MGAGWPALRAATPRLGHGRCRLSRHRHSDRAPRRTRRAQPRGPVDPVRGSRHAAGGDRPARRREGHPEDAGDLPGARRPRAGHRAHPGDPRRRGGRRGIGDATAHRPAVAGHRRRRARRARHPGDGRIGGARLPQPRAAEPPEGDPPVRDAGHRGRLRQLPGRAAPHAHGRGRGAGGSRPGPCLHDAGSVGHRGAPGHGDRGRPRRPDASSRRDRGLRARHRRRWDGDGWRHRQSRRVRRRRRDDRIAAGRGVRGARPRVPLGDGDVPPDPSARRPRPHPHRAAPWRRSWSVRPTRTTGA